MRIECRHALSLKTSGVKMRIPPEAVAAVDQYFFGDSPNPIRPVLPEPEIDSSSSERRKMLARRKLHAYIFAQPVINRLVEEGEEWVKILPPRIVPQAEDYSGLIRETKHNIWRMHKDILPPLLSRMKEIDPEYFGELETNVDEYVGALGASSEEKSMERFILRGLGTAHIIMGIVADQVPILWVDKFGGVPPSPQTVLDVFRNSYPFLVMLTQLDLGEFLDIDKMLIPAKVFDGKPDGGFREQMVVWSEGLQLHEDHSGKLSVGFSPTGLERIAEIDGKHLSSPSFVFGCPAVPQALSKLHAQWLSVLTESLRLQFGPR